GVGRVLRGSSGGSAPRLPRRGRPARRRGRSPGRRRSTRSAARRWCGSWLVFLQRGHQLEELPVREHVEVLEDVEVRGQLEVFLAQAGGDRRGAGGGLGAAV